MRLTKLTQLPASTSLVGHAEKVTQVTSPSQHQCHPRPLDPRGVPKKSVQGPSPEALQVQAVIRELAKTHSQAEIAKAIGKTKGYVSKVVGGVRLGDFGISVVAGLKARFRVSPSRIFGRDPSDGEGLDDLIEKIAEQAASKALARSAERDDDHERTGVRRRRRRRG